ncbi:MAG: hypothetical protein Q6370_007940 [Candidatus Sigynarchaeota archaeon]
MRFFEFPALELLFQAGGAAMRGLYQQRAVRILAEAALANPHGYVEPAFNTLAAREANHVSPDRFVAAWIGNDRGTRVTNIDAIRRVMSGETLTLVDPQEVRFNFLKKDTFLRPKDPSTRRPMSIPDAFKNVGLDPFNMPDPLGEYRGEMRADVSYDEMMAMSESSALLPRNLKGFIMRTLLMKGAPKLIDQLNALIDPVIDQAVQDAMIERPGYFSSEAKAREWVLSKGPGWVKGVKHQNAVPNPFIELLQHDARGQRYLARANLPFIARTKYYQESTYWPTAGEHIERWDGGRLQVEGNLHFAERFEAASLFRDLLRYAAQKGSTPVGMTMADVNALTGNDFVMDLALDERLPLLQGTYFTAAKSLHGYSWIDAIIGVLAGNRQLMANLLEVNKGNLGKLTGNPAKDAKWRTGALGVQEHMLEEFLGAIVNREGQIRLEKGGYRSNVNGPDAYSRGIWELVHGWDYRPLTWVFNPEAAVGKSIEATIDATYTNTRSMSNIDAIVIEAKARRNLRGGGDAAIQSLYDSMNAWVLQNKRFSRAWIEVTRDSTNQPPRDVASQGHLDGWNNFLTNTIPDSVLLGNPRPSGEPYSYNAQSKFPVKFDDYRQDLMRPGVLDYIRGLTPAQKASLTVADMARTIVESRGKQLGIATSSDVTPGTGWRVGILAPGEMHFARTKQWDATKNMYVKLKVIDDFFKMRRDDSSIPSEIDWRGYGLLDRCYGLPIPTKIADSTSIADFETFVRSLSPTGSLEDGLECIDGFDFETRGYILQVIELRVDRPDIIWQARQFIALLCHLASVTDQLSANLYNKKGQPNWWAVPKLGGGYM